MKNKIYSLLIAALVTLAVPALAQTANTATINFSPSTAWSDGTPYAAGTVVTYNLYQGLKGGTKTKVGSFTSGGSITTGLLTGSEYCWDVTTVVGTNEGAHSNEACKKFGGTPGTVTITVS